MTRELVPLEVPGGARVADLLPALEAMLAGAGPALLPVPADDPVRTRILVEAMDPASGIDDRAGLVIGTSGSTGIPKGAMLAPGALRASAQATEDALGGAGRWVLALPAHHIAGLQVLLRSLHAGTEPVVLDVSTGFDPAALPRAVARCAGGRAYTALVPGQLAKALDDPAAAEALAALDAVLLGGAAADPRLLERAASAGVRVVRTYGMSETAGGCVYDGVPLDGVRVEIDDDARIHLAGPQVALGYRNAPGHPAFARPGWFRTDDAGEFSDGVLRVLGRLDAALSVGGLTLLPQVLEEALRTHPAVDDAVVVGVPDDRLGTAPVAVVTARGGARPETDALRAHVTSRLGAHSAPRRVEVWEALPLLPGGKVDRRAVTARMG